jgi:hypothetical protein
MDKTDETVVAILAADVAESTTTFVVSKLVAVESGVVVEARIVI